MKKKLLIIVGAGASIEFCMPSVKEIDGLFDSFAQSRFPLVSDPDKNLYSYLRDKINAYYAKCGKQYLKKSVNFEEMLYQILLLSANLSDGDYQSALMAFFTTVEIPEINYLIKCKKVVTGDTLRELASHLVDSLVEEFITRCECIKSCKTRELKQLNSFLEELSRDFDIGVITLNYDDIITTVKPDLETGFTKKVGMEDRIFDPKSITESNSWNFIYYLHGSIHFSMEGDDTDMPAIKWVNNPREGQYRSWGRNSQESPEGVPYLTSPIIAGNGKSSQILRPPFRTYFSDLERRIPQVDSFLFLGYGFSDFHLNSAFYTIRKKPLRPVVIVDFASDSEDPISFRSDAWSYNMSNTVGLDQSSATGSPPIVSDLKGSNEFEIFGNVAIWYGGMLAACKNASKIASKLL